MILRNCLISVAFSTLVSPLAFAEGDMLKPDELQTTGVEANPTADSAFFLGVGASFGQARSTNEDVSPGTAILFHVEPGYQVRRGTFDRLELSAQLFSGQATVEPEASDASKIAVPFGLLLKAGIGHSMGGRLYGLFKAGLGPTMAKLEARPDSGGTYKSDTATGLAAMLGWSAVAPITDSLDFTGGIAYTHYQLGIDQVEDSAGNDYDIDAKIINVLGIDLGVRLRF